MNTELSTNFIEQLEALQNVFIENNEVEGIYGDGKSLVNNKEFPITNNFTDGLYMRQMKMKADSIVIAPCWSYSIKGTKRLIRCVEDCVWINVIANPTDTKNMQEVENNFFSITLEEYNKKEKLWQV